MKRLIYITLLASIFSGCQKNGFNSKISRNKQFVIEYDISMEEFHQVLSSRQIQTKKSGWWEKFKMWVKAHTGNSQKYVDGQPVCSGNGGCGPCPGICFGGSLIDGRGSGGVLTEEEVSVGLRPVSLSIFENEENPIDKKMVIKTLSEYENEFILIMLSRSRTMHTYRIFIQVKRVLIRLLFRLVFTL